MKLECGSRPDGERRALRFFVLIRNKGTKRPYLPEIPASRVNKGKYWPYFFDPSLIRLVFLRIETNKSLFCPYFVQIKLERPNKAKKVLYEA
jgi:hypothetical protein